MRLTIIVPALEESSVIEATLQCLQAERGRSTQIIVVDGGSGDDTVRRAQPLADEVIVSARSRSIQMNAGARLARGDVLLFLHADTHLPPPALTALRAAMERSPRQWGRFDLAIEGRAPILRLVARMMNLRSRLTGIATGDQGIFVTRKVFENLGGYPPIALLEDIALCRALKRVAGRPLCIAERIRTSGRRWDRDGAWRTIMLMWSLRLQFWLGRDPAALARSYDC